MSTVIKAGRAGPVLRRLATVDLADHLAEAQSVIDEAKRRAAEMIAAGRREAHDLDEQARADGYEAGRAAGVEAGRAAGQAAAYAEAIERFDAQHAHLARDMERAIAEIDAMKTDLAIAARRDVLELAVRIATKLTFEVGRLHREAAQANLRRAIELVGSATDLTIRAHPDDVATMETFAKGLAEAGRVSSGARVVADASVAPGGCTVRTDRTDIDATLDTQVAQVVSLLLGEGADG
ncbi:MAG: FliH/SctL family protein [Phycisphaerae bacterium]